MRKLVSEAEFQWEIFRVAILFGYSCYHTHDSRRSSPGFPDLFLAHDIKKRVIFIECKKEGGKVTPEQKAWHDTLARCDQEIYVAFPADLEEIIEILALGHKPSILERSKYNSAVVYYREGRK